MSYILDALRRADRERRQGQAADAGAPGFGIAAAVPRDEASGGARWLVVAGALVATGLLAAVMWWWPGESTPPAAGPTPALVQPPPALTATAPVAAAAVSPPPTQAPALVLGRKPEAPLPFLPASAATPPPLLVPAPPVPAPASPASQAAVVGLPDLPAELRQQLPTFKLSGSIFSPNRANRLLLVDGQVAREGDTVAPGVVLDTIQPRSAIFRFRQYRYEVRY